VGRELEEFGRCRAEFFGHLLGKHDRNAETNRGLQRERVAFRHLDSPVHGGEESRLHVHTEQRERRTHAVETDFCRSVLQVKTGAPIRAAPWRDVVRTLARPKPDLGPTWCAPWRDTGRTWS